MKNMEEQNILSKVSLSTIFIRFSLGFGSGGAGAIVLGLVLLFTWSIAGDVLSPSTYQIQDEFGQTLSYKENTHPLFLSVVIFAVFLATLVANLFYCLIISTVEEKYVTKSTNVTHTFIGNLILLIIFLPVYLLSSSQFGAPGVAFTALFHTILVAILTFLIIEILSTHKYILVSVYGAFLGLSMFLCLINIIGFGNPTVLTFITLPLLLGLIGAGSAIAQMFYMWIQKLYDNDFLATDKRFGEDYGKKEDLSIEEEFDELEIDNL